MSATAPRDSAFWHPFADMGVVRSHELVIDRAEGLYVWDEAGTRYLDATASLWYANVGHGREEIVQAVADQLRRLDAYSTFGDFANRPALELTEALAARAPMPGAKVFLTSGGGDSIETAAKLAQRYFHERGEPDRTVVLSRTAAYHGTHGFGTSLGGIQANRIGFGAHAESGQVAHDSADDLLAALERIGPERVAAFFAEPVIGAGGVYPPAPGYLEEVSALCRENGVLFVADAVICGFGRLGNWFGIERWDIEPDLVVFAKGVTSGYQPLGGVLIAEWLAEPFWGRPGSPVFRHGPTYAGHPACCAAGLANLALLEGEGLIERGAEMEGPLLDALAPLADDPLVAEVRGGVGTLAAVELDAGLRTRRPGAPAEVAAGARAAGVLVRPLGAGVATSPPLPAGPEHFQQIAAAIAAGLDAVRE